MWLDWSVSSEQVLERPCSKRCSEEGGLMADKSELPILTIRPEIK